MGDGFRLIVLGCRGGPREENLSSYLIYPKGRTDQAFTFDGGTLLAGLTKAQHQGNLSDFTTQNSPISIEEHVLRHHIKAYLISHAHLDHIAGLILNSQIDIPGKIVVGTDITIDHIRDYVYNGKIWPNYGNEGNNPQINLYSYFRIPFFEKVKLPTLDYEVEAFPLSHPKEYACTAFLVRYQDEYLLYFGDTSSDSMEAEKHIQKVWERVAPLIREKKLRGVFLECSVPNEDVEQVIYGHLSSKLFIEAFEDLHKICGVSLKDLKVIVTHRKETFEIDKDKPHDIEIELREANHLELDLIFPFQGARYDL
jgi:cAMP phosphodiesterase